LQLFQMQELLDHKFAKLLKKEKFDYLTDNEEELIKLNEDMKGSGLEFFNLDGDCCCKGVVCLAHNKVVMECDIIYGHHDGVGSLMLEKQQFLEFRSEDWGGRLFKLNLLDKPNSPLGFLPNYRFWLMDPESMAYLVCWNLPTPEDRTKMADSLRKVCSLRFDTGVGAHNNTMKGEDFRKNIDACWNWLDGKPLI